jgi:hypothetical protein
MKLIKRLLIFIGFVFLANTSYANTTTATLDLFKSLKGHWSIKDIASGKSLPFEMTYDLASRDSIVTEQFGKELSVFYQDKNDLLMTHYCNRGNQPRLKLVSGSDAKTIQFEMMDITNLESPDDPHVQKIIYRILDDKHMELELVWKLSAQLKSEKYSLIKM